MTQLNPHYQKNNNVKCFHVKSIPHRQGFLRNDDVQQQRAILSSAEFATEEKRRERQLLRRPWPPLNNNNQQCLHARRQLVKKTRTSKKGENKNKNK
jgi:hypothetical protein